MSLGFSSIPKLFGPSLQIATPACFLDLESGDNLLLENGGFFQLENCNQFPIGTYYLAQESDINSLFELEDGSGVLELEMGP